jgi:hypothetical protein
MNRARHFGSVNLSHLRQKDLWQRAQPNTIPTHFALGELVTSFPANLSNKGSRFRSFQDNSDWYHSRKNDPYHEPVLYNTTVYIILYP